MIRELGGKAPLSGTTAPAATMDPRPMFAMLEIVEFIPIRQSAPIVHPWTTAPWPIVTRSPMRVGLPLST
jgi:hypothetical protein